VDVYLQAKNIAFNRSTISVPAGATVNVHFDNQDQGVPHNFAVYTNSQATDKIFSGTIITGVSQTTYTFTAPSTPGNYFFRCDVHPTVMTGTFTVT
jgi:plastocyanin